MPLPLRALHYRSPLTSARDAGGDRAEWIAHVCDTLYFVGLNG